MHGLTSSMPGLRIGWRAFISNNAFGLDQILFLTGRQRGASMTPDRGRRLKTQGLGLGANLTLIKGLA